MGFFSQLWDRWRSTNSRIEEAPPTTTTAIDVAPNFSFRIRVLASPTDCIRTDRREILVTTPDAPGPVRFCNPEEGKTLNNATQLALTGDGYHTEEAARIAGQRFSTILTVALARLRLGADFGHRAPKSMFFPAGLAMLERQFGSRVLNSVHGLMTFATLPKPRFASTNARMTRGVPLERFESLFRASSELTIELSQREELAFSLFNASFFQHSADSRFLMLMMSIEALLDLQPRSTEAQSHVANMIASTKKAGLGKQEATSMIGAMERLRNESINQAGRRLSTARLGDRQYFEMPAPKFFTHCYTLRSALVHGSVPYPSFDVVGSTVAQLEVFVSDLLTAPYLALTEEPLAVSKPDTSGG